MRLEETPRDRAHGARRGLVAAPRLPASAEGRWRDATLPPFGDATRLIGRLGKAKLGERARPQIEYDRSRFGCGFCLPRKDRERVASPHRRGLPTADDLPRAAGWTGRAVVPFSRVPPHEAKLLNHPIEQVILDPTHQLHLGRLSP